MGREASRVHKSSAQASASGCAEGPKLVSRKDFPERRLFFCSGNVDDDEARAPFTDDAR